jgi:glycosyltransferase involved in cell wall biosynthesis
VDSPSVDIVIPTLNCASSLRSCLTALSNQSYEGTLSVIVVDGGSSDSTIQVAREFGCKLYVNPGQYGVGLDGARHFGEVRGQSELVWYLDSDNILEGKNVAFDLSLPFVKDYSVNLSVPFVVEDVRGTDFNCWISRMELANLEHVAAVGNPRNGWILVDDLWYGLPNASMVRRAAMERVGGFDADVAMLDRLRSARLAKAALVRHARFRNQQAVSARDFAVKWRRRLVRYGQMRFGDRAKYFTRFGLDQGLRPRTRGGIPGSPREVLISYPLLGIFRYLRYRQSVWLWGTAFPFIFGAASVPNVIAAMSAYRNFRKCV